MPERDRIEEWFQQQFGRFEKRLQPEQKQTVIDGIARDMAKENDQSKDAPDPSWGWSDEEKAKVANEGLDESKQQEYRNSRLKEAEAVESGMWEENETERTAFRFWKPERTVEAGDRPLEFPTDFRLDSLVPWERGTSSIGDGVQVYEGTGHVLAFGDIITTPEGFGCVVSPKSIDQEQFRDFPDIHWENYQSEPVKVPHLALDQVKGAPEAEKGFTEAEKQADIEELGHVIDDREHHEATWEERVEERMQASLYEGRGHTDERMVRSAGQDANSWAAAKRPEKGPEDMAKAIREMGLEPAIERQKAKEAEQQKGQEPGLERGGEGIER